MTKKDGKILKYLSIVGGVLGGVSAMEAIPFIPEQIGLLIIGLSASLAALITPIGDFLDNGKMDGSFKADK